MQRTTRDLDDLINGRRDLESAYPPNEKGPRAIRLVQVQRVSRGFERHGIFISPLWSELLYNGKDLTRQIRFAMANGLS